MEHHTQYQIFCLLCNVSAFATLLAHEYSKSVTVEYLLVGLCPCWCSVRKEGYSKQVRKCTSLLSHGFCASVFHLLTVKKVMVNCKPVQFECSVPAALHKTIPQQIQFCSSESSDCHKATWVSHLTLTRVLELKIAFAQIVCQMSKWECCAIKFWARHKFWIDHAWLAV